MMKLALQPLTREAFKPFGDVVETEGATHFPINNGTTTRFHDLAALQFSGSNAKPIVSIFRGQAFTLPLEITMMEHHPYGSQLFMPLSGHPYVVVVAPKGELQQQQIQAFLASGQQGVNYHFGVWHHPLISLEASSDFLIVDRAGEEANCIEQDLNQSILLEF
ncbi:ureidoglycolate lyase [Agarivorans sp.]|uniref:ureidoglycolate lyase n=1 Tax=Agarivorans sp. TaxID=1872412 RepID=UPI003CFED35F